LEDPKRSRVAGTRGYALVPAGPAHRHSAFFCTGLGIAEASQRRGPAWFYIQWVLNKQNQLRMLSTGAGAPTRLSAYANEEALKGSTFPQEYFTTLAESIRIARPGLPEIVPVTEFRDTIGSALVNVLGGADAATELKKASDSFRPVLEASEKGA
jgi:multiple sugar transport system substrate-binding protein